MQSVFYQIAIRYDEGLGTRGFILRPPRLIFGPARVVIWCNVSGMAQPLRRGTRALPRMGRRQDRVRAITKTRCIVQGPVGAAGEFNLLDQSDSLSVSTGVLLENVRLTDWFPCGLTPSSVCMLSS